MCLAPRGVIIQYLMRYHARSSNGPFVVAENVNKSQCNSRMCWHSFEADINRLILYDSVSVAAENVVGVGPARTCTAQTISELLSIQVMKSNIICYMLHL